MTHATSLFPVYNAAKLHLVKLPATRTCIMSRNKPFSPVLLFQMTKPIQLRDLDAPFYGSYLSCSRGFIRVMQPTCHGYVAMSSISGD